METRLYDRFIYWNNNNRFEFDIFDNNDNNELGGRKWEQEEFMDIEK